jgi:hypothetical protein
MPKASFVVTPLRRKSSQRTPYQIFGTHRVASTRHRSRRCDSYPVPRVERGSCPSSLTQSGSTFSHDSSTG